MKKLCCWSSYLLIFWIVLCETTFVFQSNDRKDEYPMLSLHEYDFLKDLYQKTNGPYWTRNDHWDFSNATLHNPCIEEWYGIITSFTLSKVCTITYIDLSSNNLTGAFPTKVENFPSLVQLRVDSNQIYGRLPLLINIPLLNNLQFGKNHFSGSIPSNMIDDPVRSPITSIDISSNSLTGTLPDWFYLVNCWVFKFQDNRLSGTVSSNVTQLTSAHSIDISNNHFHGSIISSFESFPHLILFNVLNNFFSGTLSSAMKGSGSSRLTVKMDGNNLEGPLPQQFSRNIDQIYLSSNYLTGTVSSLICNAQKLKAIVLSDNQIRGTIPSCLWDMLLITLELDYNLFRGPIDSVTINPFSITSFISIGFNQFTGTFPVTWFYQKNLFGISASNNCFQGGFSKLDCNNVSESIAYFFLDSLFSPSNCNNNYNRWNSFGGPFPSCLLSKKGPKEAYLTGNSFTGTLANDLCMNQYQIQNLNLSRNLLTGTLPESLSNITWIELDLSYNKFHGNIPPLNSSYSSPTSLVLSNNRFTSSLDFPRFDSIDITRGNLFTLKKDLKVYSESLGITINRQISSFIFYYLFLFLLFLFVAFILIYRLFKPFYLRDIIHSLLNQDKKNFIVGLLICLFLNCFLSPSYYFFHSSTFNMIDDDKVWRFSSLYLRGVMSCVFIVCFVIFANFLLLARLLPKKLNPTLQTKSLHQRHGMTVHSLYFLTFLLNISASVAVSALYVRILNNPLNERAGSSLRVFLLQIGLGWFYLLWNRYVLRLSAYHLKKISSETISPSWHCEYELMLWLSSSVLIPLFFMLLKDESCFEGLLFRRAETNQIIGEADCHFVSVSQDYKFCHRRTSYEIPFLYYNQCGLKLLQTYLPVWVYYYASISLVDMIALFFAMSCYGGQINTFIRSFVLINAREESMTEHLFDLAMLLSFGVQYPLLAIITAIKVLTQHLLLVLCKNEVVVSSWDSLPVSEIELQERPQVQENEDDHDGTNSSQHGLMEDQLTPSSLPSERIAVTPTSGQQYSWLIFYTSITFNSIILFDIIADEQGSKIGIYLLLGLLVFTLIVRLIFPLSPS